MSAHVTRCIIYFQEGRLRWVGGVHVSVLPSAPALPLCRQGFIDQSVLGWSLNRTTASAALLFREGLPLFHLHLRLLCLYPFYLVYIRFRGFSKAPRRCQCRCRSKSAIRDFDRRHLLANFFFFPSPLVITYGPLLATCVYTRIIKLTLN